MALRHISVATEQDGTYNIFVGTQWATRCVPLIAEAVGVDPANVVIHQQYLGGFFGRRTEADEMVTAAMAAKELVACEDHLFPGG